MQINTRCSQTAVNVLKTAALAAGVLGAVLIRPKVTAELAGLVSGACILAFLLSPLEHLLEKKLKRPLASILSLICVISVLLLFIGLLLPAFIRQFSTVFAILPEAFGRIRALLESLADRLQSHLPGLTLPSLNLSSMETSLSEAAKGAMDAAGSLAGGAYKLFLVSALSCLFLSDRNRILLRLELLVPSSWRRLAICAGNTLIRELRLYLRGQATIALSVGLMAAVGLTVIGVPSAPLLGIFVGIFNVIPYFGPFLGGIPAVILALSMGWQQAALTAGLLFLIQQIDGMVISPRVMGNITGFSPAVVLVALFAGARIGRIVGMLFALPCLLGIRTVYRVFVQRHEKN